MQGVSLFGHYLSIDILHVIFSNINFFDLMPWRKVNRNMNLILREHFEKINHINLINVNKDLDMFMLSVWVPNLKCVWTVHHVWVLHQSFDLQKIYYITTNTESENVGIVEDVCPPDSMDVWSHLEFWQCKKTTPFDTSLVKMNVHNYLNLIDPEILDDAFQDAEMIQFVYDNCKNMDTFFKKAIDYSNAYSLEFAISKLSREQTMKYLDQVPSRRIVPSLKSIEFLESYLTHDFATFIIQEHLRNRHNSILVNFCESNVSNEMLCDFYKCCKRRGIHEFLVMHIAPSISKAFIEIDADVINFQLLDEQTLLMN